MGNLNEQKNTLSERPPVVVIVGHVDHGKSTLLDYIRKTQIVEGEAGGITQHISAYEVEHETKEHGKKKITFLDTPGHEAFQEMRKRGANVADIAILIVSAEDGVKAQTLEALSALKQADVPYVVAITKIDKPSANVDRAKSTLLENEVYLEGLGGDIPFIPISSKTGEGIPELLEMITLVAEIEEFKGDISLPATGTVIEAHKDPKNGTSATLLIKNGTIKTGSFVVAGNSFAPVRALSDFKGASVKEASFSSPVVITGFNALPSVGSAFMVIDNKKEAEKLASENKKLSGNEIADTAGTEVVFPLIVRADAQGTLEAVEHSIGKLSLPDYPIKIIQSGVGSISEGDITLASGGTNAAVVGFHTSIDNIAKDLALRTDIPVETFDVIYELTEWVEKIMLERKPKKETKEKHGEAKILKVFNATKDKQVVGGRIEEGVLSVGDTAAIVRRGEVIGEGTILALQQQKVATKSIDSGEFGMQFQSKMDVASGDSIESFTVVIK